MTRTEAIAAAPNKRWEYWLSFVLCTLFALGLAIGSFFLLKTTSIRVASLSFAVVMAGIACMDAQRLFAPIRAFQLSASMNDRWKDRVRSVRTACLIGYVGLFLAGILLAGMNHDLGSDLKMAAWLLFMVRPALSDLIGERSYTPPVAWIRCHHIAWSDLKPIDSDHWGEH